jgi:CRP/FNR family transcriptional regulator, anaerobic regulatory protein
MFMQRLKSFFESSKVAGPAEVEAMLDQFHPLDFKKNEILLHQGDRCKRIIYILNGCAKVFNLDEQLKETIVYFGFEGWWMGDVESFFNDVPSQVSVQALEPMETCYIRREDFFMLAERFPRFREGYMTSIRNNVGALMKRMVEERTIPVEERYKKMLETQPHIIQRIPQGQIALFLGIEPQSLSRIRKRMSGK